MRVKTARAANAIRKPVEMVNSGASEGSLLGGGEEMETEEEVFGDCGSGCGCCCGSCSSMSSFLSPTAVEEAVSIISVRPPGVEKVFLASIETSDQTLLWEVPLYKYSVLVLEMFAAVE
jgi:hypothetical protein